jgi:hypothetical protein
MLRCPWTIPCDIATINCTFDGDLNHPIPRDSAAREFSSLSVKIVVYTKSVSSLFVSAQYLVYNLERLLVVSSTDYQQLNIFLLKFAFLLSIENLTFIVDKFYCYVYPLNFLLNFSEPSFEFLKLFIIYTFLILVRCALS